MTDFRNSGNSYSLCSLFYFPFYVIFLFSLSLPFFLGVLIFFLLYCTYLFLFLFDSRRRKIMTESVKDPRALVVTSQPQMLDKLQLSEVQCT